MDDLDPETYSMHAARLGLEYYVTGRFAVAARLVPVSANLLHHGIEMLLKAAIVLRAGVRGLHRGHNLPTLWRGFKRQFPSEMASGFDSVVKDLHAFEHIRYPDDMMREGAAIVFGFEAVGTIERNGTPIPVPNYRLSLDDVDVLVKHIFSAAGINPSAFPLHGPTAQKFLNHRNKSPLV
jgi:hypothetical protein